MRYVNFKDVRAGSLAHQDLVAPRLVVFNLRLTSSIRHIKIGVSDSVTEKILKNAFKTLAKCVWFNLTLTCVVLFSAIIAIGIPSEYPMVSMNFVDFIIKSRKVQRTFQKILLRNTPRSFLNDLYLFSQSQKNLKISKFDSITAIILSNEIDVIRQYSKNESKQASAKLTNY